MGEAAAEGSTKRDESRHRFRVNTTPIVIGALDGLAVPFLVGALTRWLGPSGASPFPALSGAQIAAITGVCVALCIAALVAAARAERARLGTVVVDAEGVRLVDPAGSTTFRCAWPWLRIWYSPHRNELAPQRAGNPPLAISGGTALGPLAAIEDLSALRATLARHANVAVVDASADRATGKRAFLFGCLLTLSGLAHGYLTPRLAVLLGLRSYRSFGILMLIGPIFVLLGAVQWATGRGGLKSTAAGWGSWIGA
jgi:hypothetical protein